MTQVLVVHPDLHIAEPTAAALRAAGHKVIVVDSGERAIDLFVQDPAQAIVVDLDLPGRDGVCDDRVDPLGAWW